MSDLILGIVSIATIVFGVYLAWISRDHINNWK